MAIETLGVEPIARPVNLDGTSTYKSYIFVRKDSGIKNTADMKSKRLVLVEKVTTAGYIFPMAYFKKRGINIDAYFKEYYFAGTHDAAINAVLEGKADVGCAKNSMFDGMARNDPGIKNKLTIIAESSEVPSNGLSVRKNLSAEIKKRLRDVLLGMDKDAGGKEALKKFEAIRFVSTAKGDYKPVFDIAKSAGINNKLPRREQRGIQPYFFESFAASGGEFDPASRLKPTGISINEKENLFIVVHSHAAFCHGGVSFNAVYEKHHNITEPCHQAFSGGPSEAGLNNGYSDGPVKSLHCPHSAG